MAHHCPSMEVSLNKTTNGITHKLWENPNVNLKYFEATWRFVKHVQEKKKLKKSVG